MTHTCASRASKSTCRAPARTCLDYSRDPASAERRRPRRRRSGSPHPGGSCVLPAGTSAAGTCATRCPTNPSAKSKARFRCRLVVWSKPPGHKQGIKDQRARGHKQATKFEPKCSKQTELLCAPRKPIQVLVLGANQFGWFTAPPPINQVGFNLHRHTYTG